MGRSMRIATVSTLAVLGTLSCSGGEGSRSSYSSPPVILVSLDTCRADRLGCYGSPAGATPNLDALAKESVLFTDCISQSSNTGPSHRSLFTGQFPSRHQHSMYQYVRSPYMLAGLLRDAGYETVGFAGGGFMAPELGFAEGFDFYTVKNDDGPSPVRRGFRTILPQAERWYEERMDGPNRDRPWFMFLHTYDIHCPYWPTEPFRTTYGSWYTGDLDLRTLCGREAFDGFIRGETPPSNDDLNYLNNMYDAGIAMTDAMLGEFMDKLRDDGTLDEALLIVTSDHGESLGEHRWVGHNHFWEEQLKVPLLIRFPDKRYAGMRSEEPVMLVDVLPTILDELGLAQPGGVQGESLLPVIEGTKSWKGGERLRVARHEDRLSFRFDQRYKVNIRFLGEGQTRTTLFDLQEDPRERNNLGISPDNPQQPSAKLLELVARYQEYRDQTSQEDELYRGAVLEQPVTGELADELTELGYVGFDEEDGGGADGHEGHDHD